MANWRLFLREIRRVQTEIMRLAPFRDVGLIPNPGASETAIAAAEKRIGRALPSSYREFLREHDGWPRFFEGATLLGTAHLGVRLYEDLARAAFEAAETPAPEGAPKSRTASQRILIPFGADLQATTLFAFEATVDRADEELPVVAWVNELGVRRESFAGFLELVFELCELELVSRKDERTQADLRGAAA
jgi:hypothetical protein